jgi:hypothetical protein
LRFRSVFWCFWEHDGRECGSSNWDACGTNSDPVACRTDLSKAYQEQQKMLLDVLAAMNGRPKAEQEENAPANAPEQPVDV